MQHADDATASCIRRASIAGAIAAQLVNGRLLRASLAAPLLPGAGIMFAVWLHTSLRLCSTPLSCDARGL